MNDRALAWQLLWLQQLADTYLPSRRAWRGDLLEFWHALERGKRARDVAELLRRHPVPEIPDDVVLYGDRLYPDRLAQLDDAPFGLFVEGERELLAHSPSVAVVGSRQPRSDSVEAARRIAGGLASAGVAVVSGLARGVDGAAHSAAVDREGLTIAVLGSGFDHVYPRQHRSLARRVVAGGGLLVSEYAGWVQARPWRFAARNRVIAGISDYVVVVQARQRSGSMRTVDYALQVGVDVGAVPSHLGDVQFDGSLELLRAGCRAVIDADSVCRALGLEAAIGRPEHAYADLLEVPRTPDELATLSGSALEQILCELVDLELDGLVARTSDGRYVSASSLSQTSSATTL